MSKDFSIIIPHRGHSMGLWATIASCDSQLKNSDFSYEYCILSNGDERESDDLLNIVKYLEKSQKLGFYKHSTTAITAPYARQQCAAHSSGDLFVFFDNHCIVDKNYFDYTEKIFVDDSIDILHSSTLFYPGQDLISYHYNLTLSYNFWGYAASDPKFSYKAYTCGAAGHGGFIVRKSVWDELGGYGPEGLLNGYAGEEVLFDLKAWRLGKKVHIHPKLLHYHSASSREYSRHFTNEYYINLMVSALIIGGESWLNKVFDSFSNKSHLRTVNSRDLTMFDLYTIAYERGIKYSKELDKISKYSLDQLLNDVFIKEEVAF